MAGDNGRLSYFRPLGGSGGLSWAFWRGCGKRRAGLELSDRHVVDVQECVVEPLAQFPVDVLFDAGGR